MTTGEAVGGWSRLTREVMAVASVIYNGFWALPPILLACPEITVRRVPILSCHMAKQCRDKNGIAYQIGCSTQPRLLIVLPSARRPKCVSSHKPSRAYRRQPCTHRVTQESIPDSRLVQPTSDGTVLLNIVSESLNSSDQPSVSLK